MNYTAFKQQLKQTQCDVDTTLNEILPDPETAPARQLARAMHYGIVGQGKRLRPFFVVESAAIVDKIQDQKITHGVLRTAAAVEMVHCYSLIHDDLPAFDDDDLRRGKPTTHIVYDDATAILAGNSLLSLAFQILADEKTHPKPETRITLIALMAHASGVYGLCGGQMLDMQAEKQKSTTIEDIKTLQSLKTGALFRAALLAGATLAQADAEIKDALEIYAENVGLAFQLADDLLDHESTTEQMGKKTGKDQSRGKATFVHMMGVDNARKYARNLVENACDALSRWDDHAQPLRQGALYIVEREN